MSMPRVLVSKSHIYDSTNLVLLRRDIQEMVAYNTALLSGEPCNHAFYLMAHCDVFFREYTAWKNKHDAGKTTAEEPIPPLLVEHAADKATYTSSYVSKPDLSFANEKLLNIADCLQKIQASKSPSESTAELATEERNSGTGKTHLIQTINCVHGQITYPASLLALFLLGEDDFFVSQNTKPLDILPLCHFMENHGDISEMSYSCGIFLSEENDMEKNVSADSLKRFPPIIEDYIFRDKTLAHICPLLFYMFFEKRKQDQQFTTAYTNRATAHNPTFTMHRGQPFNLRFRLQALHHQSSTHMIVQ
jgi:hypothetical protein